MVDRATVLANALRAEAGCLQTLSRSLEEQRAAVASGATDRIEASARALARVTLAVDEARRNRATAITAFGDGTHTSLRALASHPDGGLTPDVVESWAALQQVAATAAREAAINRQVIQRALDAGDAYLQRLFAVVAEPTPVYQPRARAEATAPSGALLSRTA